MVRCACSVRPCSSSVRAMPLSTSTSARRAPQILIGSYEALAPAPASAGCGRACTARLRGRRPSPRPSQSPSACARESWLFPTTSLFPLVKKMVAPASGRFELKLAVPKLAVSNLLPSPLPMRRRAVPLPPCLRKRMLLPNPATRCARASVATQTDAAPALDQRLRGGARRGAGGQNVIDQQNVLLLHSCEDRRPKMRRAH